MASIPNKGLPGRITPHPGEFLREMLDELGVSQTTFHRRAGMSIQRISEIINGKRGVTPETAWILGGRLRSDAEVLAQSSGDARSHEDEAHATCRPHARGDQGCGLSPVHLLARAHEPACAMADAALRRTGAEEDVLAGLLRSDQLFPVALLPYAPALVSSPML